MKGYVLSEAAVQDLEEIHAFIAKDDSVAADRVLGEFRAAFRRLAALPGLGHLRPDLTAAPVRFWPLYTYLVVYHPEPTPLLIVRVLSGFRDIAQLLEKPTS